MKKYIVKIAVICMIMLIVISNFALAMDFADADNFITQGGENAKITGDALTEIASPFTQLGNILRFVGVGILVGATAYMGIMYMISPPEKQAKLKQQSIGLIVAAVVIFGGYFIWSLLSSALDALTGPSA